MKLCTLAVLAIGCASAVRPFSARPVVWEDDDRAPFAPRPPEQHVSAVWEVADGLFLRPVSSALSVAPSREAVDVNALDEVPSSSWFENRIGRTPMTPEEVARGACDGEPPLAPFVAIAAKPDGVNPGMIVRDARGARFVLKVDASGSERATAAEAIVAAIHHAAGYHVPCNRVVFFRESELSIDPEGPSRAEVGEVLSHALRVGGRVRASMSRFIEGEPLGPWSYRGRMDGDRNDRVPHELRRELRGLIVLAAWVDHVDARAHNTLASWIPIGDRGYVRHYLIDFGDSLGSLARSRRRAARYGHTSWFDTGQVATDLITFGLVPRPWHHGEPGPTFGFFDGELDPAAWHANHPNGAFELADEGDRAWMARILARFADTHIRALAALGRFRSRRTEAELARILIARRDRILERHLTRLSPLVLAPSDGLCADDLMRTSARRSLADRRYSASIRERPLRTLPTRDGVCVELPPLPEYAVIDVRVWTPDRDRPGPLRVHLRDGRVVGLERPP